MGHCFKLCDIAAVSEYNLHFVGVICLNFVILQLLVNIICIVGIIGLKCVIL